MAPVTIRDIDSRFSELRQSLLESMQQFTPTCNVTAPIQVEPALVKNWKTWSWHDGRIFHFVPPDWNFPSHLPVKNFGSSGILETNALIFVPISIWSNVLT